MSNTSIDALGLRGRVVAPSTGPNPLVAGRVETATAASGLRIVEDGYMLTKALKEGDWVTGVMAGVAGVADAVAMAADPLGTLFFHGHRLGLRPHLASQRMAQPSHW